MRISVLCREKVFWYLLLPRWSRGLPMEQSALDPVNIVSGAVFIKKIVIIQPGLKSLPGTSDGTSDDITRTLQISSFATCQGPTGNEESTGGIVDNRESSALDTSGGGAWMLSPLEVSIIPLPCSDDSIFGSAKCGYNSKAISRHFPAVRFTTSSLYTLTWDATCRSAFC